MFKRYIHWLKLSKKTFLDEARIWKLWSTKATGSEVVPTHKAPSLPIPPSRVRSLLLYNLKTPHTPFQSPWHTRIVLIQQIVIKILLTVPRPGDLDLKRWIARLL
jgi:hypothetical protein